MNMLTQNALATLYGPTFLLLYVCVIVTVCISCAWAVGRLDTSQTNALPLVPAKPDPLEIAYLRGGENEVTRVAVFDLIERGFLEMREERTGLLKGKKVTRVAQTPNAPDAAFLPALEQVVFGQFRTPQTAQEIFKSGLPARVKEQCAVYEQSLRDDRLLNEETQRGEATKIGWLAVAVILGLGGYKLWAALTNGYDNVFFLILLAISSLVAIPFICQKRRVSRRGKAYLKRLQQAFEPLKKRPIARAATADISQDVLLLSVFGTPVLTGTPHAAYAQMFAQSSSSGGCGGGSGGCGSGGGSCGGGGGCGGCGGGG